jgi:hypothetical protein
MGVLTGETPQAAIRKSHYTALAFAFQDNARMRTSAAGHHGQRTSWGAGSTAVWQYEYGAGSEAPGDSVQLLNFAATAAVSRASRN